MKRVLIGHRGVGKTSLLERYKQTHSSVACIDLDFSIEAVIGMHLNEYFEKNGEAAFREIEKNQFQKITAQYDNFIIAVGGGFDVSLIPSGVETIFVSRVTDTEGRIFLNRPRLNAELTPLEEYQLRYIERQPKFMARADRVYHMPEGIEGVNAVEQQILKTDFVVQDAYYTLLGSEVARIDELKKIYKKIELRTDLIKPDLIIKLTEQTPQHDWLVSIRTDCAGITFPESVKIDRDVQFAFAAAVVISSHHEKIGQALAELRSYENTQRHLKLSPFISAFEDLILGYEWQQADPEQRSFLPRSANGRWLWYRQAAKYLQQINFIKGKQSVLDQPSLYQWLVLPDQKPVHWGAVLGQPVHFSKSPLQHEAFMKKRNSYFTAVDLNPRELADHILFLKKMGLGYAAVTSPLKESLYQISDEASELAKKFSAANTLYFADGSIKVENTDYAGFQQLSKHLHAGCDVAVWGGGGTLEMMRAALPEADFYSSQTGLIRDADEISRHEYQALVWAAPRRPETKWPLSNIKYSEVVDLNYAQNSMGLEVAEKQKARYISGLEMFQVQAEEQRRFWTACELKHQEKTK